MIHNSLTMPRSAEKETKQELTLRKTINHINKFFGLETVSDRIWFYGVYGFSSIILFVTFVLSNILDAFRG
jgi:hypothetical protein